MVSSETIIFASQIYTIIVYLIFLIGGLIGNFYNVLVFRCFKLFQRNQCAFYLMSESIASFGVLIVIVPFRIAEYVFAYDSTQLSLTWCKLRQAIAIVFAFLSLSAICYAAMDQYLSTHWHAYLRHLSTLKLSHRLICVTIMILILYSIPFMIFFEIQLGSGCIITNVIFARFFSFVNFCVFTAILPITISVSFALLAYTNVRRIVRRQIPIARRRLDRQLTAMVLTKVAFLVVATLPYIIFRIYTLNIPDHRSDTIRMSIEQLIFVITASLYYIYFAVKTFLS